MTEKSRTAKDEEEFHKMKFTTVAADGSSVDIRPFNYAMSLIGGKWKMQILFRFWKNKVMRCGELKRSLEGVIHKMLSNQLKELEADGLIERREYPQVPPKVEYSLSDLGHTVKEIAGTLLVICVLFLHLTAQAAQPFEFHLLDVGQGQSALIEADGEYMLIDGGGRDASSFVVSYLQRQEVEKLDYIAASHYDEDHIAGLIGALTVFQAGTLLLPDYVYEGAVYDSFSEAASSNGCAMLHPAAGEQFQLGGAIINVVGPLKDNYPEENDRSLALKITYGNTSYLICGDAQEAAETDMAQSGEDLKSDVYVADHHGSATSSTDAFLDAVSPRYAMISCGQGNSYGHPAAEALARIRDHGCRLFRTDVQGTVIAYSDGTDISFNADPCDDWTSGSETASGDAVPGDGEEVFSDAAADTAGGSSTVTSEPSAGSAPDGSAVSSETGSGAQQGDGQAWYRYVCNINTMRFHYPDCASVTQMSEKNRIYTVLSRDELIAQGFSPCGNCRP